jgi:hypothetical protein
LPPAGWSPVAAGLVAALSQGFGVGARIAWGMVADWWGSGMKALAAIGVCTCLGGALLPLALAGPPVPLVVLLGLLGTCAAGWNGLLLAEAARLAGMERQALRALRADARQPAELVDEVLDRTFVHPRS